MYRQKLPDLSGQKFRKMFGISMGLCRADLYMPTHVWNTAHVIGKGHDIIAFLINNGKITGYFTEDVISYMGKHGLRILKKSSFVKNNQKEVLREGSKLWNFCEYLAGRPLKHLPDNEMISFYNDIFDKTQRMFGYFNVSQPCISFAIETEIMKRMKLLGLPNETVQTIAGIMLKADEKTMVGDEEIALIEMAMEIKKEHSARHFDNPFSVMLEWLILHNNSMYEKLLLHHTRYSFLASSENFDEFDLSYFANRIREMVKKTEEQLMDDIAGLSPNKEKIREERDAIIKRYNLSDEITSLYEIARIYSHQRMVVRIYWTKAIWVWGKLLREIARRIDISENDVQYITRKEINDFFEKGFSIEKCEISKRREGCVYVIIKKQGPFILAGKEAKEFEENYLAGNTDGQSIIRGMTAFPGIRSGKVKVLVYGKNMVRQVEDMQNGDILITGNTRPDMIFAMKKASAIVTDEGGICSHAALVSRELKIPCIVGTRDATRMFKDGDIVEVNASEGIVRKI
ncbi:hypothetical protein J4401_02890 [Candidatus Woesearchaeota archaeon]|nr:hypothetical protein [Candidatus Woesearchaeota archaeon]